MQKITIVAVGNLKTDWIKTGCGFYKKLIGRHADLKIKELPASKNPDPGKQIKEEADRISELFSKTDKEIWLLDEKGEYYSTFEFSGTLKTAKDRGKHLVFVIGGAYGTPKTLKDKIKNQIAVSCFTLPHELCRLILMEQIYRAEDLLAGGKYHH